MGALKSVSVADIKARGSIKDNDVARLRQAYYADSIITPEEAEALFRLNDACPVQDPAWADCFVEMITDYLVEQVQPEGYLTAENARWLIDRMSADGKVETKTELELLINVIDKARWVPASLVRFALEQVKAAVLTGEGPTRSGLDLGPGIVTEGDVELLRRILYACGGDGSIAITQAEAEILFDIDDATADAANHPSWQDLFVKAVANCVMSASNYAAPSREEALARNAWLERRGELDIGAVLSGMGSAVAGVLGRYRAQSTEEAAIARLERQKVEIITHEEITPVEAAWLGARIARDGRTTANEAALLRFLKCEAPSLHPDLQKLLDAAGKAA